MTHNVLLSVCLNIGSVLLGLEPIQCPLLYRRTAVSDPGYGPSFLHR